MKSPQRQSLPVPLSHSCEDLSSLTIGLRPFQLSPMRLTNSQLKVLSLMSSAAFTQEQSLYRVAMFATLFPTNCATRGRLSRHSDRVPNTA